MMRLQSIFVKSFGNLKDFTLNFDDNFSLVFRNNGFGKSTVAKFVKAMLYGLNYSKIKDKSTDKYFNEADLVKPWDSDGKFGGTLTFTHDGKTYKVERYFGITAKSETCTVTVVETGETLPITNVGEHFLGLTAESYERCTYLPQEYVEMHSNDNFDKQLAGMVDGSEDYGKIEEKLTKYVRSIKSVRGVGEFYRLTDKQNELEHKLQDALNTGKRCVAIDKELEEMAQRKAELQQQMDKITAELKLLQKKNAEVTLTPQQVQVQKDLAETNLAIARTDEHIVEDEERVSKLVAQAQGVDVTPHNKNVALLVSACVSGFVGVVAGVTLWLTVGWLYGIIAGLVGLTSFGVLIGLYASSVKQHAVYLNQLAKYNQIVSQVKDISRKYVSNGANLDIISNEMWQLCNDYKARLRTRETLQSMLAGVETKDYSEDIAELEEQCRIITEEINDIARKEGSLSNEYATLSSVSASDVADSLQEVNKQIDNCNYRLQVAESVLNLLNQAKAEMSVSYLPRLCSRCGELLAYVTNNSYSVVIDRNFVVSITHDGLTHKADYYSRGIREITLLCFRIALAEVLYEGTVPFVIIDDAFVNYDEDNLLRALKVLDKLNTQVVFFTCQLRTQQALQKADVSHATV